MADDDYKELPLDQLLEHKLWKARQFAYTQLQEIAESNINDASITDLSSNIERLKKMVGDSNVISQESGIQTFSLILKLLGPKFCIQTRESLVPIIIDKGLSSSRVNAKNYSTETLLLYAELDSPDRIIELMIPSLNAKSPKQVTATVKGINEIYKEFGCNVVSPKLIMEQIPKLFAHSDKNVRADATSLSVTIRSYIGDSFDKVIFPKLKPIQQKDLTKLFDKIEGDIKPNRLTRDEQEKLKSLDNHNGNHNSNDNDNDIEMTDINIQMSTKQKEFDPYEFEVPVDVLSKLPNDLSTRVTDSIWKQRVEVLEEIGKFFKVIKIQDDDFHYFISLMVGCLKDVNLQVVALSCGILIDLANGLKSNFSKYIHSLINPLLERTKEKKKNVLDSLNSLLDLCFKYGSFNEILDPIVEHMTHVSPPVKVETMQFLVRCLKEINFVPNNMQVEQIMNPAVKLLLDSQLPVRNSASDVIGTLMKLIGPKQSKYYLDKIDKRHLKKVQQICDNSVVKAPTTSENTPISSNNKSSNSTINDKPIVNNNKIPELKSTGPFKSFNTNESGKILLAENRKTSSNSSSLSSSSIPSKRTAASPLKENTPNQKNALTSRSLKVSNVNTYGLSTQQLQELELLKAEKVEWLENRKQLVNELDNAKNSNDELIKNVVALNGKLDDYHNKLTTMNMTLKSKDTQILRFRSDLELSQNKNMQLQQKVKLLESQLELMSGDNNNNNKAPTEDSSDINRRISILSIDSNIGESREEPPTLNIPGSSMYNFDDNDDGWKRATAITNDLKAKIQQMKSRSRLLDLEDD